MASLPHPKLSLTSLLPSLTPKTPSSNKLPFLSRSSTSHFHGAQISHHILPSSLPSSSSSFKFTISAKVPSPHPLLLGFLVLHFGSFLLLLLSVFHFGFVFVDV